MDDSVVIDAVLAGDTAKYALLVNRYKQMAFTIAVRFLKNREDAEEIAQDAFVKAFQNLRQFRRQAKFSTWLYRIVFNLCATAARKKKPEVISLEADTLSEQQEQDVADSLTGLEIEENRAMVREALGHISGEEAAIVTLFYFDTCSVEEIGGITGYSVANVKVKLFRARKKLYVILKRMMEEDTFVNRNLIDL